MKNFALYISILSFLTTAFLSATEVSQGCNCTNCTCTAESHCGCLTGEGCQTAEMCQCHPGCGCKKHRT